MTLVYTFRLRRLTRLQGPVEAGAPTGHPPAGYDAGGGPRDHPPPRVTGAPGRQTAWVTTRPCRAPHHTIADVDLIGGGQVPLPGEWLAPLFLGEWPELTPQGLKGLRPSLENGIR
jgi:hypothetical protein